MELMQSLHPPYPHGILVLVADWAGTGSLLSMEPSICPRLLSDQAARRLFLEITGGGGRARREAFLGLSCFLSEAAPRVEMGAALPKTSSLGHLANTLWKGPSSTSKTPRGALKQYGLIFSPSWPSGIIPPCASRTRPACVGTVCPRKSCETIRNGSERFPAVM